MLEGAKHKYNRKGEAQKLQTGKPIWPINVFCLTLPLHDVEKKKNFFLTERFHVKIFSASLQRKTWQHWAYKPPWQQLAVPFGRVYAPKILGVRFSTE